MWNDKKKAITFSYDDGVTQDIRLISLFNKYGLKATFNLNSEKLGHGGKLIRDGVEIDHNNVHAEDVRHVYAGHEIAAHTLTHPTLTALTDDTEIIRQVEEDRLKLSELAGYEVVGFAYPGGGINHSPRIAELLRQHTGVKYARTTDSNHAFELSNNLYQFSPSVYHHKEMDYMFRLAEEFLAMDTDRPQLLYIWGHAYEFDIRNDWDRFEEFCQMISSRSDIFYGTNKEVLL
ncbi:MAG: polysaccharide deacetylase family protein [Clostridia bacterium]|nr:polysaccharide deacetylase family protein [Clostridia bacterium]